MITDFNNPVSVRPALSAWSAAGLAGTAAWWGVSSGTNTAMCQPARPPGFELPATFLDHAMPWKERPRSDTRYLTSAVWEG